MFCKTCAEDKSEEDFYFTDKAARRRASLCRSCAIRYQQEYNRASPKKYLIRSAKTRARIKGLEFSITEEDLVIPTHCPVLGIELRTSSGCGQGPLGPNSLTLDRINNDLGYISGNVEVISWRANSLKSNASPEELRKLAAYYG